MLEKKHRTPVQKFPRKAKTAYSSDLFVIKKASNTLTHSRVGVIVSKGVVKKAVSRNKIRRTIMDAFGNNKEILRVPGFDYLVIMNSSDKLDGEEYVKLNKGLGKALAKLQT